MDRRRKLADDVGGLDRMGQRDRLDIADPMVGDAIAPGHAPRIFEHRKLFAWEQLGDGVVLVEGSLAQVGRVRPAGADQGPRIMGRDDPSGERDVGDVAAIGVGARVQPAAGPRELETVTRAGG